MKMKKMNPITIADIWGLSQELGLTQDEFISMEISYVYQLGVFEKMDYSFRNLSVIAYCTGYMNRKELKKILNS